jgi:hypothetical protein
MDHTSISPFDRKIAEQTLADYRRDLAKAHGNAEGARDATDYLCWAKTAAWYETQIARYEAYLETHHASH